MNEATLTSKSQLTLPKAVRDALGVDAGDRIRFVPSRTGFRIVALKGDVTKLRGLYRGRRAKAPSIDELNETISLMGSKREPSR
jgi:bifunctional DNA-binding transcriptional regulator/antitoxin component of YhaV-PrlF toxin-antitoxin module